MNVKSTSLFAGLALCGILAVAANTGATRAWGERSLLPGSVELRLTVSDELGNPVPDNRFVTGEVVLLTVTLLPLKVLDARAALDEAQLRLRVLGSEGSPEKRQQAEQKLASAHARMDTARTALAENSLQERADHLVVKALLSVPPGGSQVDESVPIRRQDPLSGADTSQTAGDVLRLQWQIETSVLQAGTVNVTVSPGTDATATAMLNPAALDFAVVSTDRATAGERARATYVKAHVALEKKAYRQVIELAAQAAELGEANSYYRMAALHVLGDAHFALGNKRAALQAYREVLVIAKAAFPKSGLPTILGPRVRQLEAFGQ